MFIGAAFKSHREWSQTQDISVLTTAILSATAGASPRLNGIYTPKHTKIQEKIDSHYYIHPENKLMSVTVLTQIFTQAWIQMYAQIIIKN